MKTRRIKKRLGDLEVGAKFEFPEIPDVIYKIISKTSRQVVCKKTDNCYKTSSPATEVFPL